MATCPNTDPKKNRESGIPITIPAACAGLLTFLAYLPSLWNGFVHWDDDFYVYENPNIRAINARFFKWVLTSADVSNWHPLSTISHAVDYAVWGLNPFGHHLTSIFFHGLNASLVYILAVRVYRSPETGTIPGRGKTVVAGLAAALIFGLHPLRVESVSWVSERKDVLSGFFFLLSAISYIGYARFPLDKGRRYLLSLACFSLSLLSKPMAVSLPLVLLILDFYPLKRIVNSGVSAKKMVFEKLPFFILSASSVLLTLLAQSKGGAIVALESLPVSSRAALAIRAYAFYAYKMLLPMDLAPFYPHPLPGELFNRVFAASLVFFVSVTACCIIAAAKGRPFFLAAWLYYVVTLFPVIGFVQAGGQAAADRYTYLPGISLALLAGAGAVYGRFAQTRTRVALACAAALALFAIAGMTVRQEGIWKDTVSLFTYEIDRYPDRVFVAYNNRGMEYERFGQAGRALNDFSRAAANNPYYADPYINRGALYLNTGRIREALRDFDRAVALAPGNPAAYLGRGNANLAAGNPGGALTDFEKAAALDPGSPATYYGMGVARLRLADPEAAATYFRKAALMQKAERRLR